MKKFVVILLQLLAIPSIFGQDPHFSQFYANPLYTNPALTGTGYKDETPAGRITTNYRNQWPGLPGNFRTFCLGWDQAFDALNGALGAQFISDVSASGMLSTSEINLQYAYAGQNKKQTFQYRIGGRFSHVTSTFNPRIIDNMGYLINPFWVLYDTSGMRPDLNIQFPNFGLGIHLSGKKWNSGIQIANAIEPNNSFYQNPGQVLPKRWVVHGGYAFKINSQWQVTPQIQGMKQARMKQVLLGALVNKNEFFTGAWYRKSFGQYQNSDAIVINLGYAYKGFKLMYSYDQNISDGRSATYFSHELSLQFHWKTKQKSTFQSQSVY